MGKCRHEALLEALINGEAAHIIPRSRVECILKAMIDGEAPSSVPQSRIEAYLLALAKKLQESGSGGTGGSSGGEGVKTCTVRFNRSMWSFTDPELCFLAYTAFVNGKIENVVLGEYSWGGGDPLVTLTADDNSVVFENVLCGTQMSFIFNDRGNGYEVTVDENVIRNLNDDAMYGIWAISPDATDVVLEISTLM